MPNTPDALESLARIRVHEATISRHLTFNAYARNDKTIRDRLATAAVYLESVIDREYEIEHERANS